ncbi:hypothetical protein HK096_011516, partial [Nowakowskiella sp. JEL0078]
MQLFYFLVSTPTQRSFVSNLFSIGANSMINPEFVDTTLQKVHLLAKESDSLVWILLQNEITEVSYIISKAKQF